MHIQESTVKLDKIIANIAFKTRKTISTYNYLISYYNLY